MLPTSVTKQANNGHEQQEGHPARDRFPRRRCVWGDRMSGANRTLGRTPCPPRRPPETTARLLPTSSCPRLPTRRPASSPPRADGSNPALRGSAHAAGSRSLRVRRTNVHSAEPVHAAQTRGVCRGRRHENRPLPGRRGRRHETHFRASASRPTPRTSIIAELHDDSSVGVQTQRPGAGNLGDVPKSAGRVGCKVRRRSLIFLLLPKSGLFL